MADPRRLIPALRVTGLFSQAPNLVVLIYQTDGQQHSFVKYLTSMPLYSLDIRLTTHPFNISLKHCVRLQEGLRTLMLFSPATTMVLLHDGSTKVLKLSPIALQTNTLLYGNPLILGQSVRVILMSGMQRLLMHPRRDQQQFSRMSVVKWHMSF